MPFLDLGSKDRKCESQPTQLFRRKEHKSFTLFSWCLRRGREISFSVVISGAISSTSITETTQMTVISMVSKFTFSTCNRAIRAALLHRVVRVVFQVILLSSPGKASSRPVIHIYFTWESGERRTCYSLSRLQPGGYKSQICSYPVGQT